MIGNADIRANLVGQGFQKTPMRKESMHMRYVTINLRSFGDICQQFLTKIDVRMNVIGEIKEAVNFDNDDLYIEWEFFLPPHWKADYEDLYVSNPSEDLKRDWNVLQTKDGWCCPFVDPYDDNQLFNHTVFIADRAIEQEWRQRVVRDMRKFPILFLTLGSIDSWGRKKLEGYSYIEVPRTPGYHEITVKAWTPSQSIYQKVHEFFLGGQTKLYDVKKIAQNSTLNDENTYSAIDRHNLMTESKGGIRISMNVAFQSIQYKDEQQSLAQARGANLTLQREKLLDPIEIQKDQIQNEYANQQYAPVIKNAFTTSLRYKNQGLN